MAAGDRRGPSERPLVPHPGRLRCGGRGDDPGGARDGSRPGGRAAGGPAGRPLLPRLRPVLRRPPEGLALLRARPRLVAAHAGDRLLAPHTVGRGQPLVRTSRPGSGSGPAGPAGRPVRRRPRLAQPRAGRQATVRDSGHQPSPTRAPWRSRRPALRILAAPGDPDLRQRSGGGCGHNHRPGQRSGARDPERDRPRGPSPRGCGMCSS